MVKTAAKREKSKKPTAIKAKRILTGYAETCRVWCVTGMLKPGKSWRELSRLLGMPLRNGSYKLGSGDTAISNERLPIIAEYIGEPIPPLPGTSELQQKTLPNAAEVIEIERVIGIDTWAEDGQLRDTNIETIQPVKSSEFPNAQYRAYRFKGDSMENAFIKDGDIVHCVDYEDTASMPLDGKKVVIERVLADRITGVDLRIAQVFPDRTEFVTASKTQAYKPVIIDKKGRVISDKNEKLRIVAVQIGLTRIG